MKLMKTAWVLVCAVALYATAATSFTVSARYAVSDEGANAAATAETQKITVDELKAKFEKKEKIVVLDVRGGDYDQSAQRIKGALRPAGGDVHALLKDLPKDTLIVTYCACGSDGGSMNAAKILRDNGFKQVLALKGGWNSWVAAGGPVENK